MMHMTFYWGTKVTLLFNFWSTDSILDYSLTLLACLLFSAFYQYLESRRLQFQSISASSPSSAVSGDPAIQTPLLNHALAGGGGSKTLWMSKAAGALTFGVNSALGYLLMLAVMSFNGGVFIAVVVGLSIGYLIFRSPPPPPQAQAQAQGQSDDVSCGCA